MYSLSNFCSDVSYLPCLSRMQMLLSYYKIFIKLMTIHHNTSIMYIPQPHSQGLLSPCP